MRRNNDLLARLRKHVGAGAPLLLAIGMLGGGTAAGLTLVGAGYAWVWSVERFGAGTMRAAALGVVALAAVAAVVIARRRLRDREVPGRCPRCGFDMRATPYRCPECGDVWLMRR